MSHIKINRARNISALGKYPQTWDAIIKNIPSDLIESLTSKQLVDVILLMQKCRAKGAVNGIEEFCEHHEISGCPWRAKIKQIEVVQ